MNRQPFIVGFAADKILGFLAGVVGSVIGLIATIVVMFLWAGSDPLPDTEARRRHATSVSIWSGIGCALPAILIVLLLVMGVVFLSAGVSNQDPGGAPFPVYP